MEEQVKELVSWWEDMQKVYMESADDEGGGILLACDICRDQGRDRIVKQLGWTVTFAHAAQEHVRHLTEHEIIAQDNDPR